MYLPSCKPCPLVSVLVWSVTMTVILSPPGGGVNGQEVNADPPSTTVKTTTVRTVPPTPRDKMSTLAPVLSTTSQAAPPTLPRTTHDLSTKNFNELFTTRPTRGPTGPTERTDSGAQVITSCRFVHVLVPLFVVLLTIVFHN